MREDFLHFCWRWRRFDMAELRTTDGQTLEILHPGELNQHAGPDFFNARIRLNGTLWAGNIELHVRASEWLEHGHQRDKAYDNVILHVVFEEDVVLRRRNGDLIPCLSLHNRLFPKIIDSYFRLEHTRLWIPCASSIGEVSPIVIQNWCDRLLVERLEEKTQKMQAVLAQTQFDWEEAFHRLLARNFGLKVNTDPFEHLANSLPLKIIKRHRADPSQVEALFFGQAGLLEVDYSDSYPLQLQREYRHLAHKYGLEPIPASLWKFLRLRPANFPTVRIAQLAALYHKCEAPFNAVLEAENIEELENLFATAPAPYWLDHYQFDKPSKNHVKIPGREFIHLLAINTLAPMLFLYGKERHRPTLQEKALAWLETLPAERNAVINQWHKLGIKPAHAYQSQALLHLRSNYCEAKRCLSCAIGTALLKE